MPALTAYPIPQDSGLIVARTGVTQIYMHGIAAEAQGGEVFLRFHAGADGFSFYPIHLLDGESRSDPPWSDGIIVADDLYVDVIGGEFLVAGAVFMFGGS